MNCQKADQQIHLFNELTKEEQKQLLNHIAECEQCKELFESMKLMLSIVTRISKISIEPIDSFRLTNKIMLEVSKSDTQSSNLLEHILSYMELKPVKLVMAAASILLFSLFAIEQTRSTGNLKQQTSQLDAGFSILNAKNFQDQLNNYKASEKRKRIKTCENPFNNSQLRVACLREKNVHFKNL